MFQSVYSFSCVGVCKPRSACDGSLAYRASDIYSGSCKPTCPTKSDTTTTTGGNTPATSVQAQNSTLVKAGSAAGKAVVAPLMVTLLALLAAAMLTAML